MHTSDIFSKEWCDIVFEGRNKEYGAYKLREQTGARYRRVLVIMLGTLSVMLLLKGSIMLYTRIVDAKSMKEAADALPRNPQS